MSECQSREMVHHTPRVVGVCDLGTFTALILIADVHGGRLSAVCEERHTIDLTRGQSRSGRLPEAAMGRAIAALERFASLTEQFRCDCAAVVGTAALRGVRSRADLQQLRAAACHPLSVLSARSEAELAALGARSGLPRTAQGLPVIDIGGGSTEMVDPGGMPFRGFRLGAATATSLWAGDCPRRRSERAVYFRRRARGRLPRWGPLSPRHGGRVVGAGGTIVTLAALAQRKSVFDPVTLHGRVLAAGWIDEMAETLAGMPTREIAAMIPFDPARARVLTAGTFLWAEVINRLCVRRVIVSTRGLRWGAAGRLAAGRIPGEALAGGKIT